MSLYSSAKKRRWILLFLKVFSWETDDFTVKNAKSGREICILKIVLSRNEIWCAAGNHNYMSHACAKGFLDSNFNEAVIDKKSKFSRNCPNFTYSQKSKYKL